MKKIRFANTKWQAEKTFENLCALGQWYILEAVVKRVLTLTKTLIHIKWEI